MNSGFISEKIGADGASSQRSCRAGLTNNRGLLRARNRARRRRPPRSTPSRQEACLKAEGASEARTSICTCGHDISCRQPELAFKEASLSDRCQGRMRRRGTGPLPTPISFPPQGLSARRKFKNKTTQTPRLHDHRLPPYRCLKQRNMFMRDCHSNASSGRALLDVGKLVLTSQNQPS